MRRLAALLLLAGLCVGCGGGGSGTTTAARPTLPRPLARDWARRSDAVAAAAAAGRACRAARLADALRTDVVRAVNDRRVPQALLEPLVSAVNGVAEATACGPREPAVEGARRARDLAGWLRRRSR